MPVIRCPSCKTVFKASDAARGAVMSCPSCAQLCRIPAGGAGRKPPAERSSITASPHPRTSAPEDDLLQEVDELEEVEEGDEPADEPPPSRKTAHREGIAEGPDDDEPVPLEVVRRGRRRKRRLSRRPDGDLDRVNLGLGFYYASILTLLAGFVAELAAFAAGMTAFGNAVAGEAKGVEAGVGMAILLGFLAEALISWIAPLLGLVGSVLCLWAPAAAGARGFSIASVALNASAWLAGILFRVVMWLVPEAAGIGALGLIPTFLMTFIAWCLFMVFLRQLCAHLGEETLANEAMAVMFRGILILALTPVAPVVGMVLIRALMCMGASIFLVAVLFGLYGLFLFLRRQLDLIGSIRQVIASRY